MQLVTHRFVKYFAPGSFVSNDWTVPITTLDPQQVPWPDGAYAFSLHERTDIVKDSETFEGKTKQIGPLYYHPGSKVVTLEQLKAKDAPKDRVLISNMECNEWAAVVYTRWGNWPQPFDSGVAILR